MNIEVAASTAIKRLYYIVGYKKHQIAVYPFCHAEPSFVLLQKNTHNKRRKLFLITLPLRFKTWVGYFNPSNFVDGKKTSHGSAQTITNVIDFYTQDIFTFLFAAVFN